MKLAGLLLLVAGWLIAVAAVALFPSVTPRTWFVLTGVAVELLGLALVFHSHLELRKERG